MKKILFIISLLFVLSSCVKVEYRDIISQNPPIENNNDSDNNSDNKYDNSYYINKDKTIFKCDDIIINTLVDHTYLYGDMISQILVSAKDISDKRIKNVIVKLRCIDRNGNILIDLVDETIYKYIYFEFNENYYQYTYNKHINFYNKYAFNSQIIGIKIEFFDSKYDKLYNIN